MLNLILTELAWKYRHREIVLFDVQCFPFRIPAEGLEDSEIRRRSKSAQFSPTLTLSLSLISYSTQHFLFGFVAWSPAGQDSQDSQDSQGNQDSQGSAAALSIHY